MPVHGLIFNFHPTGNTDTFFFFSIIPDEVLVNASESSQDGDRVGVKQCRNKVHCDKLK